MNKMNEQTKELLESLIELLREGNLPPWRKPWADSEQYIMIGGVEYLTNRWPSNIRAPAVPYGAVNGILLWLAAQRWRYKSNFWIDKKVVESLKMPLRENAKPVDLISFQLDSEPEEDPKPEEYSKLRKDLKPEEDSKLREDSKPGEDSVPWEDLKLWEYSKPWQYNRHVYNVEQIRDPEKILGFTWSSSLTHRNLSVPRHYNKSNNMLEKLTKEGLKIKYGGNSACYVFADDVINMPELYQFNNRDSELGEALYWGTLWHEVVHWTGADRRLDRQTKKQYALEELIAELGACLLCAHLKIKVDIRSASYVSGWLENMKQSDAKEEEALYNQWADLFKSDFGILIYAAMHAEQAKKYVIDEAAGRNKRNKGKKTDKGKKTGKMVV